MDKELGYGSDARLYESASDFEIESSGILQDGGILLCTDGYATVNVNYNDWKLSAGSVITFFPGDIVKFTGRSCNFKSDILTYSPATLREASLDIEQTVYSSLREDRCRGGSPIVTDIVTSMFALLKVYFRQPDCTCLNRLVTYQLKVFFIGFHDYLKRYPEMAPPLNGSKRKRSLFNEFMSLIERNYKKFRDVCWYAEALSITPKYLNIVCKLISGHKAKEVIDHYVILKLKMELKGNDLQMKQIAWDYNFSDSSFFTRYFKQHTGITPLEFRHSENNPNSLSKN